MYKGGLMYESLYMKCPEQANPETESKLVIAWSWELATGGNREWVLIKC